jgi:hypothetical protein
VRRWARVPPAPVPRRGCDCEALSAQNAELRARLELLATVFQAADAYTDCVCSEHYRELVAAVLAAGEDGRG